MRSVLSSNASLLLASFHGNFGITTRIVDVSSYLYSSCEISTFYRHNLYRQRGTQSVPDTVWQVSHSTSYCTSCTQKKELRFERIWRSYWASRKQQCFSCNHWEDQPNRLMSTKHLRYKLQWDLNRNVDFVT